jgi:hypothetical protein
VSSPAEASNRNIGQTDDESLSMTDQTEVSNEWRVACYFSAHRQQAEQDDFYWSGFPNVSSPVEASDRNKEPSSHLPLHVPRVFLLLSNACDAWVCSSRSRQRYAGFRRWAGTVRLCWKRSHGMLKSVAVWHGRVLKDGAQ